MRIKLKPIAVAITLLLAAKAYANSGAAGDNGAGSVIGNENIGQAGSSGTTANGADGASFTVFTAPLVIDTATSGSPDVGENGESISSFNGAGGAGGNGGGSVIGASSTGGSGGVSIISRTSTNGGNGGNVTGKTIEIINSTLAGAAGGAGGDVYSSAGGGAAGHGGGSVFGGVSTGGAGGSSFSLDTVSITANGGHGGDVTGNTIKITSGSRLEGAAGGAGGGAVSFGTGGAAGHGGGSVFGGISTGGAAGRTASGSANGGNGGAVTGNTIEIINSTLTGADGGTGGLSSIGGSGTAGHGGGSVFGGISTGGAGGISYASGGDAKGGNGGNVTGNAIRITNSTLTGASGGVAGSLQLYLESGGAAGHGGGSVLGGISTGGTGGYSSLISNGGNGGGIAGNTIEIINSTLTGAAGGAGGTTSTSGGGAAGHGGGSVFGGISTGGTGGYSSLISNGGNGGAVTGNTIEITNSTLTGAAGGAAGSLGSSRGGGGAAGHGGGSVFGGISTGGAAGRSFSSVSSIIIHLLSHGGNGGDVTDNQITLTDVNLNGKWATAGSRSNVQSGGSGVEGHGGGSVFGGISTGGAAGQSSSDSGNKAFAFSNGGNGGGVAGNTIEITNSTLTGAAGGAGGSLGPSNGGGGAAGHGGGSVFGGVSTGGAAGGSIANFNSNSSYGGNGGDVTGNTIEITNSTLTGADGGTGRVVNTWHAQSSGGGGAAGHGGGSVFGGISTGGAGGISEAYSDNPITIISTNGGNGGDITVSTIKISNATLAGGDGGAGGDMLTFGGGGAAGHGGGSVFGGVSTGAAAGYSRMSTPYSSPSYSSNSITANGGNGGRVTGNTIEITNSTLIGADGGAAGSNVTSPTSYGGGSAGGHGGGSVFGGISTGGAAGYVKATTSVGAFSVNGGHGGIVTDNTIEITNSTLAGADGGARGSVMNYGGVGAAGHGGGSVFGGISTGGAGGYSTSLFVPDPGLSSANGGNGGNVLNNKITLSGVTSISGDIYGGLSQGGAKGKIESAGDVTDGIDGEGGVVQNNTITLIGSDIQIGGSIYGGLSLNGAGLPDHSKAFSGNTLNLVGYQGSVQGIRNIENYNWTLPEGVFNGATIIDILGNDNVLVDNTKHTIAMYNDGNRLFEGDAVVMISKAEGTAAPRDHRINQGHFLRYDAVLETIQDVNDNGDQTSQLILTLVGKEEDSTPVGPIEPRTPAGELQETSKKFLVSRLATMATLNRGTDMLADLPEETCRKKLFGVVHGGSHRSNTGNESHIKVNDASLTFGGATCFELQSKSTVMLGGFVQHGRSNYDSYNYFDERGDVYGWGKVHYTGVGLLFEMNVAETGTKGSAPAIGSKNGLYLNAVLSAGRAKTSFASNLRDTQGVQGKYDSTSPYLAAMVGAGYAWKVDEKRLLDFYGHYTFGHLGSDTVMIGKDRLSLETMKSSRLRLGARYYYAAAKDVKPYVGVAFEHEFMGHAYGSAYNMSINNPSLKGSSGVVEVGVSMKPSNTNKAWTVNMGVQGTLGDRRGVSGGVALKYVF